jgi:hypothetical protein
MVLTSREKRDLACDEAPSEALRSGPGYRNHLYHPNIFSALSAPDDAVTLARKRQSFGAVAFAY